MSMATPLQLDNAPARDQMSGLLMQTNHLARMVFFAHALNTFATFSLVQPSNCRGQRSIGRAVY